ncbi:thiamine-phosphate kinase [Marinivivus vitaminiproducens]|uniref:thiamine-phosphate kinase n=1 Tax=Marinivivus vitaminiproducens TaxID=3035935 RepID=UPI0027A11799|nr:thiamine-phosphate kinase [Geminicoccaceae bacterium SCSIO 64248]
MGKGEFDLIETLLRPLTEGTPGAFGLADDAAVVPPAGEGFDLVVTKDAMVEGVHFLPDDPADTVGQKLMRENLSDIAAMGAEPVGCVLAWMRPKTTDDDWLAAFIQGIARDQAAFACPLLGGDTVSTPGPLAFSLTVFGRVPAGCALRRNGARPGDDLWVSGKLGDGRLGLALRLGEITAPDAIAAPLVEHYRRPMPRLDLGRALVRVAHACLDVSDGLMGDLGHIRKASGVGAELWYDALPLSPEARTIEGARDLALAGGDDYELLFTAASDDRERIEAVGRTLDLPVTRIGRITEGDACRVLDRDGRAIAPAQPSWQHF